MFDILFMKTYINWLNKMVTAMNPSLNVIVRGKMAAVIAIKLDRVHKKCALTERSMIAF